MRVRSYLCHGFQRGDRILIHFGNRLEFFAELLAIWRLGGCAIPVDNRLTPFETATLARAADAQFSVIDDDTGPETLSDLCDLTILNTLECDESVMPDKDSHPYPCLDDDALILFTSGSTGEPKGVVHSHRTLYAKWISLEENLGLESFERTLCVLPTHFGHGLICNCLYPWLAGCDLYIAPPFSASLIMQIGALIDEHAISFVSSVPSLWNLALRTADAPRNRSLKRIHVGSAPLSESLWRQIQAWAETDAVENVYGITETGSWVAGTASHNDEPESGLVGSPWGARIRILDPAAGTGQISEDTECHRTEPGMIWLMTPALMTGYFNRPDLTNAVVEHGWFNTGDIGFLDDRGRLVLKGRERDEINKGGLKIYPADIDEVVHQFGAVTDVCTFAERDDLYGENVAMAFVLTERTAVTLRELSRWVESHLARHKQPVNWYLLDEIPRTSRGKINRRQVAKVCESISALDVKKEIELEQ